MEGTPTKETRNERLFEAKRGGATFIMLSTSFRLSVARVKEIYYRECRRRGLEVRKYRKKVKGD